MRILANIVLGTALAGALLLPVTSARAQEPGEQAGAGRGMSAGMQRVSGGITAVSGMNLTMKAIEGGTVQIVTTTNTRVMKDRTTPLKLSDIKVGDGVMGLGNLDEPNKTLHAAMLLVTDAAQVQKMKDNLGKTYIAGRVTAVDLDNAKMTVQRPDGVSQTIGFDETTSFKRGRFGRGSMGAGGADAASTPAATSESITLADIKVGDNVGGPGALKAGVFVPAQLTVATPRPRRESGSRGTTGAAPGEGTAAPK